jgi:hypothetical protein
MKWEFIDNEGSPFTHRYSEDACHHNKWCPARLVCRVPHTPGLRAGILNFLENGPAPVPRGAANPKQPKNLPFPT